MDDKDLLQQKEIQEKIQKIEQIYQKYLFELAKLQKEQNEIIKKFRQELERRKIEEIKKTLDN